MLIWFITRCSEQTEIVALVSVNLDLKEWDWSLSPCNIGGDSAYFILFNKTNKQGLMPNPKSNQYWSGQVNAWKNEQSCWQVENHFDAWNELTQMTFSFLRNSTQYHFHTLMCRLVPKKIINILTGNNFFLIPKLF